MNELFEKLRSPKILIAAGIIGIILIFISSLQGKGESKEEIKEEIFSVQEYKAELEDRLKDIVFGITGSKNSTVIVTLEGGISYSYADTKEGATSEKGEKENKSVENEVKQGYITVKTADGGEQALLVTTQMPEIRGVAIVCDMGDSEAVKEKIENAVTAALNITSKRVYVCGRKQ